MSSALDFWSGVSVCTTASVTPAGTSNNAQAAVLLSCSFGDPQEMGLECEGDAEEAQPA